MSLQRTERLLSRGLGKVPLPPGVCKRNVHWSECIQSNTRGGEWELSNLSGCVEFFPEKVKLQGFIFCGYDIWKHPHSANARDRTDTGTLEWDALRVFEGLCWWSSPCKPTISEPVFAAPELGPRRESTVFRTEDWLVAWQTYDITFVLYYKMATFTTVCIGIKM